MVTLSEGPVHPRWGPYIRNPQPIAPNMWLVEAQRGLKAKGKTWYMNVIHYSPSEYRDYKVLGEVKPKQGKYSAAQWQCSLHGIDTNGYYRNVRGTFPDEHSAVAFMIRNAPEFLK